MCTCVKGEGKCYVLLNKYVSVHVHVRGEKGCVYVHVHAWVKDLIYWLKSMCVCLCVCVHVHS